MKYSCCIEMLFTHLPFAQRIYAARDCGFDAVEFWCWEDKDLAAVETSLRETGLGLAIFQGNTVGRMVNPAESAAYVAGVKRSVEVAGRLGAKHLFLMSDIMGEDRSVLPADVPLTNAEKTASTIDVLRQLAELGQDKGITFVIEPLNTRVDHPGYSLCHSADAFDIVRQVGSPRVRVLYDAYHMQIMEGNLIETIRANVEQIGYFHVADVPGRAQPGTGELNYKNILGALRACGYNGTVGFEFEAIGAPDADVARAALQALR